MNDNSIGGLVVLDSSEQAKMLFEIFQTVRYQKEKKQHKDSLAAEPSESYGNKKRKPKAVTTAGGHPA
jgi:type I restriction enzyme R subunit